jgi:hypothetical protein
MGLCMYVLVYVLIVAQIKAQIARHINIHSAAKAYVCTECGRGFNFKQKVSVAAYHYNFLKVSCIC